MTAPRRGPVGLWLPVQGAEVPDARLREGVFQPNPLPLDLVLDSRIHSLLARAEQGLGRVDESARRLPEPISLMRATQVREAQRSASVDDMYSALREVFVADLNTARAGWSKIPMLSGYLNASKRGYDAVREGAAIDVKLLADMSRDLDGAGDVRSDADLAAEQHDIPWRDGPGWLGGPTIDEAYLLTSPPGQATWQALDQFVAWNTADCALPLVGKLALGYLHLTLVQPFKAGNGHLARLYVGLELMRVGVLRNQLLPISAWLDDHQEDHRAQILQFVHTGDFSEWIKFFATGIDTVSMNQVRLVEQLEDARAALLAKLDRHAKNGRATGLIRDVAAGFVVAPITNHRQIADRHDLHQSTAINMANRLTRAGIVENIGNEKYGKIFMAKEIMRVLSRASFAPANDDDVFE